MFFAEIMLCGRLLYDAKAVDTDNGRKLVMMKVEVFKRKFTSHGGQEITAEMLYFKINKDMLQSGDHTIFKKNTIIFAQGQPSLYQWETPNHDIKIGIEIHARECFVLSKPQWWMPTEDREDQIEENPQPINQEVIT